jgi:tetratricopeptide (TPR) repeat protein
LAARLGDGELVSARLDSTVAIWEQTLGPDHPNVANSLDNLANVHHARGAYDQAQRLHERAIAILERAFGSDHPEIANSLVGLAEVALATGHAEQARQHLERALLLRAKNLVGSELARTRLLLVFVERTAVTFEHTG